MTKLTEIKSELKALNEADLHGLISGVILEIKTRAYHEGFDHAITNGHVAEEHRKEPIGKLPYNEISPQQLRDEIVNKAKRDIDGVKTEWNVRDDIPGGKMRYIRNTKVCTEEFIVNKEKRTIVCILRWDYNGSIVARGIAKCDPTDCFNVHIGKAIALRRALGLEVPADYLSAPQPTDVRVGDVVHRLNIDDTVTIRPTLLIIENLSVEVGSSKIIDDSREGVME
jgi:hypothetical protein